MPTTKGSKGGKKSKGSSKGVKKRGGGGRKKKLTPSTDPIIITGGNSLYLEYADQNAFDGFDDDGSTSGARKKLKHKGNAQGRKAELTRIEVYSPAPNSSHPPP